SSRSCTTGTRSVVPPSSLSSIATSRRSSRKPCCWWRREPSLVTSFALAPRRIHLRHFRLACGLRAAGLALHFRIDLRAGQNRQHGEIRPEIKNDHRAQRSKQRIELREAGNIKRKEQRPGGPDQP